MVTKCQLSRNLQVRERANTVSAEDGLVKTEPKVQDTKEPVSKGHSSGRQRCLPVYSAGPTRKLTDTRRGRQQRASGRCGAHEVGQPPQVLFGGAQAELRGVWSSGGSQTDLIRPHPTQLKSKTQMIKLSSEH